MLKPFDHDTQLIYRCPECELEHWKSVKEVTKEHQWLICPCGYEERIQQLFNPRFVAGFTPKKKGVTNVQIDMTKVISQAIDILCGQGFGRAEAAGLVNFVYSQSDKTLNGIVRLSLEQAFNEQTEANSA